jgi:hypothetical protein
LRLQCPARGEPIALHALSGVDDPPETRGLKFSTVIARSRTQSTSLCCPVGAVPRLVSKSAADLGGCSICLNALAPKLPRELLPPATQIRLADIQAPAFPLVRADDQMHVGMILVGVQDQGIPVL